MALTIGSRLGHYQVDALIGEGGIGQVYQATDTRLNGQKILPHVAADPDLKQRFGGGGRSGADLVRVPQVMRLTPSILAVSVVVMVVACATLAAATDWEPVTFRGTRPTEYTYERLADGLALRADSKRTASGLVAELPEELDPTAISWRWRLERCLDNAEEHDRAGDDFAARVFVLFGRDQSWTPWGWLGRQLIRSPFGRIRPKRALSFVWASRAAKGDATFSPVSGDVYQIAARGGCRNDAVWVAEHYELAQEFAQAFQEPMPYVVALAVMTDTDDTASHAVAWYGDVMLHLRTGEKLAVPFEPERD